MYRSSVRNLIKGSFKRFQLFPIIRATSVVRILERSVRDECWTQFKSVPTYMQQASNTFCHFQRCRKLYLNVPNISSNIRSNKCCVNINWEMLGAFKRALISGKSLGMLISESVYMYKEVSINSLLVSMLYCFLRCCKFYAPYD